MTKQSVRAAPGQHTIIFTLTRQQMQHLSKAPSSGIQSARQAPEVGPTRYQIAKVASTIHVFFLSRHLLNIFSVAMGLTRGQRRMDRVQGGERADRNSSVLQPETCSRAEQLLNTGKYWKHKEGHEAISVTHA